MILFLVAACWPDIRGRDYEPWDSVAAAQEPAVVNTPEGNGVTHALVDSTDAEAWVYVDADEGMLGLAGDDPGWDLGFSRQRIKLDGGVSGDAGVEVAIVEAAKLEGVTAPPTGGYVTDVADDAVGPPDDNLEPEYAFDAWFAYNSDNHVLTPKDLVFVVKTDRGNHVAIEILDYYDDAGTSGVFSLRWKEL